MIVGRRQAVRETELKRRPVDSPAESDPQHRRRRVSRPVCARAPLNTGRTSKYAIDDGRDVSREGHGNGNT